MYNKKVDGCKNNPKNSLTTKVSEHVPSCFPMPTISSFRSIENKHDVYRGKDYMKKFFEFLREYAMKILVLKRKKMKLLKKSRKLYYLLINIWKINIWKIKNIVKSDLCHCTWEYRSAAHNICNLKYSVPKKIRIVFHNGHKRVSRKISKTIYLFRKNTEKAIKVIKVR